MVWDFVKASGSAGVVCGSADRLYVYERRTSSLGRRERAGGARRSRRNIPRQEWKYTAEAYRYPQSGRGRARKYKEHMLILSDMGRAVKCIYIRSRPASALKNSVLAVGTRMNDVRERQHETRLLTETSCRNKPPPGPKPRLWRSGGFRDCWLWLPSSRAHAVLDKRDISSSSP